MDDYSEYDLITEEEPGDNNEIRPPRKFARSGSNSIIAGVCGGFGEYLNVEPNLLRVIFVILSLFGGWGIIAYIIFSLVTKIAPDPNEYTRDEIAALKMSDSKTVVGTIMIMVGIYFVLAPTGLFWFFGSFGLSSKYFFAVILLGFGIRYLKNNQSVFTPGKVEARPKLYRSKTDRRFMGVCGGLSDYLNIDSTLIRVGGIVSLLLTAGVFLFVYFIFAFSVSYEPEINTYEE